MTGWIVVAAMVGFAVGFLVGMILIGAMISSLAKTAPARLLAAARKAIEREAAR